MTRQYGIYWVAAIPALLLAIVGVIAVASPATIPHTFVPGQVADANQVNQNFQSVKTAVDDNDARITTNTNAITTNTTAITTNATAIAALQGPARPGTMLAHFRLNVATGSNTNAWTSTGTAVTSGRNGVGDLWFTIGGVTLAYQDHVLVAHPVNVIAPLFTTMGSATGIGHPGGFRVRQWDAAGAASDGAPYIQIAVFNQ